MTADLIEHIDHFQHRVVQDALQDATAAYWRRRADTFDAARPRAGDYFGRATREQVREQDARLAAAARACRARADVLSRSEVAA
jgi:hypothetical protein